MPYNQDGIGHQGENTSSQSAEDLRPKVHKVRDQVLMTLRINASPMTSEDIAEALGMDYATVQPRTSELKREGKIEASGRTKKGRFGKQIVAWQIKEEGVDNV